jgi:Big-like domain-containing protein/gametolysin peptidase M11
MISRSGTLHATVIDNFRTGESTTRYTLKSAGQATAVRPTELAAEAGDRVVVTGEMRDDRLVGAVKATGAVQAAAIPAGPRKTAVLLINPSGGGAGPWSQESARSEVFTGVNSASAFYEEESYGAFSLTGKLREDGDVFGWFNLNTSTAGCPFMEWQTKAKEAAADAGIDLSGYQHLIYMFPFLGLEGPCKWFGIAGLSSNWVMINGDFGVKIVTHELGHNLGLLHAGSLTCTSGGVRVQISDNCTSAEYGDPFDTMGSTAARHSSGWNLDKLGIIAPENVETIESSGTYSMRSALHPTAEPTTLRIPHERGFGGEVTSWYYLEVREQGGVFENVNDATMAGVSIRIAPNPDLGPETLLLDANPATATFNDAPLGAGQTFDSGGPVQIKTLSAGGGKATVSIKLDEEAPSAPSGLTATGGVDGVQLEWGASTDNLGVDRYLVFRDGSLLGTAAGTSFFDSAASVGDHEYVVYAEDGYGNRSAASNPAVATVEPDEEPPTTPTGLTASVELEGVQLEWEASSDNLGVERYLVFRNGKETGTAFNNSFLDPLAPAGNLEYVLYAEDAAGNLSGASAPAFLTVPAIFGPVCEGGTCTDAARYTGATTPWTVPPGVQKADFTVEGARGGDTGFNFGAGVEATLGSLTPGDVVTLSLGGVGEAYSEGGDGGFGGGGDGTLGGGGGGFSSVTLDSTLMLLAGGGGGGGANGSNPSVEMQPHGGSGGSGGVGAPGNNGSATDALGATLGKGRGGISGGNGGLGGAGGEVTGTSACAGGASAGGEGAAGVGFSGGGGAPGAGGGGGGGYVGGGQGGGGGGDACGDKAGAGGGGGGSSFAAPGLAATFSAGVRSGNGRAFISYLNPVKAVTHKYLTTPGQELAVPAASGVLSGVSGPSGVQLSARVGTPPAHGSVTVDADGSFTYAPAPVYSGGDSFTYQVTDPSGNYATAQVTLTVAAPPSATISAPVTGGTYEIGQSVSTAFSCSEGAGGSGLLSCTDSAGVKTGSGHLDTSSAGGHAYTVTALSKDGLTKSTSIDYTVVPKPALPNRPEDPPAPAPGVDLSLSIETKSLRELLRTQKLELAVAVNKAASVRLTGSAKLFKGKTVRFAAAGERDVTLMLSEKGREALRKLSRLRLAIVGNATGAPGDAAKRTVTSVLQREHTSRLLQTRSW